MSAEPRTSTIRRAPAGPAGPAGRRPAGRATDTSRPPRRLPDPRVVGAALATQFAALFCEVEAGLRPRRHLEALMSPLLFARVGQAWVRGGTLGVVMRVHGDAITPTVYEGVAVVRRGDRVGALALRLVNRNGRWRVEDLARPEDGPLPPAPFPVSDSDDDDLLADLPQDFLPDALTSCDLEHNDLEALPDGTATH